MKHLSRDFHYALRSLWKRPAFAAVVMAALALCIGANTAIFSIVNSVLLHGLPFRHPDRLVWVSETLSQIMPGSIPFSTPDYEELVRRNRSFAQLGIFRNKFYELSGTENAERVTGLRVSASLFPTLGVSPTLGRNFTEQEDRESHRVAILSAALWHSKFGSDPRIIGKSITLDRLAYTIIGVMPEHFTFPLRGPRFNDRPAQVFVPISFTNKELTDFGNMYNDSVIARLRPGVTLAQARADVQSVTQHLFKDLYPSALRILGFVLGGDVTMLRDEVVGRVEPILWVLFGAVGLVLLIGCADVASLLLTRATSRRREMSIRTALGASQTDLIRQVLIESIVLALAGGALGLLLSVWITNLLVHLSAVTLPLVSQTRLDPPVLLFTLGLSLATALFFGIFPALQTSHIDVSEGLRESTRSHTAGRKQARTLSALVCGQFALALILLVGAGLLVRSFSRLLATNPGFRPDHILTMSINLPTTAYQTGPQVRSFFERLQSSLQAMPGVKAAAIATSLPLSINEHDAISIENQDPATLAIPKSVNQIWSMGNFFEAMGIPLKHGRLFDKRDGRNSPMVIIVSETFSRRFFPHESALGKRLKWGVEKSNKPWMTIVGVVGDVKQGHLNEPIEPETYTPYEQVSDDDLANGITNEFREMKVLVRTANDPVSESAAIQRQIRSLDSSLPVTEITTMHATLHESTRSERFNTILLGAFAAAALVLAALGIAGVLAYSVAQRISEIGLRLALGARKLDVLKFVVWRGMRMAGLGAAIGILCSLAVTRAMSGLLFETSPLDAATLLTAPLVLCIVGLLSVWIPAHRAASIDPIQALRVE